jgi:hypothetical protein
MKTLIALFLVSLPAAAQACGMAGKMGAGMGGGMMGPMAGHGGGHAATVLYAVLAALGYWVLQHAAKETANYVKKTGAILGMALVVIGLLGFLCGVGSHIRNSMPRSCTGQDMIMRDGQEMMMRGEGKMPMQEPAKASEPVKKNIK